MRISREDAEYRGKRNNYLGQDKDSKHDEDYFLNARANGHTTLKVVMLEKGYEHIAPATITLTIVDPFIILPAEADEDLDFVEEGIF
jgi:hypothetical protein